MTMKVKEIAELAGVSVRTLHHYDEIGLLVPDEVTEAGYRIYSDKNLDTLQQILFFKELGFPLEKIKEIMHNPSFDRQQALIRQRDMLYRKRSQLNEVIRTIEKTIQESKGERKMPNRDKFTGFDFSHNPYEEEARERWGDEAVDESEEKVKNMNGYDQEKFNEIFRELARIRGVSPESDTAQDKIGIWYHYLNEVGNYSPQAFEGLGHMYVNDERFTENIDQFGEGLAAFMSQAMSIYAERNKS
ncbi:MerR family transcriptional regulator [Salimicrobium humidisoli]|uniref:MerR family transcriptional regulator n=1 Tax=Salimicrobium humidisoli TaxID=2029857 RepID=A0ABX4HV49_9BACI|nr:MerR family transcriptional regulator [Salimicrobium humidisoli]PBB06356.1 MerR family transcriptional regulator [Salimicrobium humidisoli]